MDLPHNIRELIVGHHRAGKGSREIAKILSVSKSAVNNLVKRFKNFGSVSPTRIGNCGRPRLLSNRDERLVARASVINPTFNARDIRAHVGASIPQVSLRTIQRSLIRRGRLAYRPRKSPDLSPIKRAVRLRWCRKYQNFTDNQWRRVSHFAIIIQGCIQHTDFFVLFFRVFRPSFLTKPISTFMDLNLHSSDDFAVNL
jgi:DNA-binding MarR family transcriptional regulator